MHWRGEEREGVSTANSMAVGRANFADEGRRLGGKGGTGLRAVLAPGLPARKAGQAGMFAIIGILVVFGAVAAGYLMEHGHLAVLVQPAELLIIGGAGAGTLLIANPVRILKKIASGAMAIFGASQVRQGPLSVDAAHDVRAAAEGAAGRDADD